MIWNPVEARKFLDNSPLVEYLDERDKLVAYKTTTGNELALIEENAKKVSVYVSRYPNYMPDVLLDGSYKPTTEKKGRHSNLELITESLGFNHQAFKLNITSKSGFDLFLSWYQYA